MAIKFFDFWKGQKGEMVSGSHLIIEIMLPKKKKNTELMGGTMFLGFSIPFF